MSIDTTSAIYQWTGHPLVDMGIATLVLFAGRKHPSELTLHDLESFAAYTERAIGAKVISSHASVLFTSNVSYLQPSFSADRKQAEAARVFRAFNLPPGEEHCVYCGKDCARLDSATGRAYRDLIPLLTGRGIVNFAPSGQHGLPVCGFCLTALQALVLGAPSCEGRALVLSADDPEVLLAVMQNGRWLEGLKVRIDLSLATGEKGDGWRAPRTRLVEQLVALERDHQALRPSGFTIFHASNSGQGPSIDIYNLGAEVARFVRRAQAPAYSEAWRAVEMRSWQDAKRKAAGREPDPGERAYWRNWFYDALFGLPQTAGRVIEQYLLRPTLRKVREAPHTSHTPLWGLAELLIMEVLQVEKDRSDRIRMLADALADEVAGNNDRPLFRRILMGRTYPAMRATLIQASTRRLNRGTSPLVDFDGYLSIFEEGEDFPATDWRLAWDLVKIRLLDQLYERGWFRTNPDAAQEVAEDPDAVEELDNLPAGVV